MSYITWQRDGPNVDRRLLTNDRLWHCQHPVAELLGGFFTARWTYGRRWGWARMPSVADHFNMQDHYALRILLIVRGLSSQRACPYLSPRCAVSMTWRDPTLGRTRAKIAPPQEILESKNHPTPRCSRPPSMCRCVDPSSLHSGAVTSLNWKFPPRGSRLRRWRSFSAA